MIVAIANQKGGVGKTTTAVNLAASVAAAERRTLLVDLDPQGNASSGVGISPRTVERSVYDALIGRATLRDVMKPTELPTLKLVPSKQDLVAVEVELVDDPDRPYKLRAVLGELLEAEAFDYVFVDCPPSLGILTVNALAAADKVLVPMQCEYYALEGLTALLDTIGRVRETLNPTLSLEGLLLTMFDGRNSLARQVQDEVRTHFGDQVFRTVIPRNVRVSESPSHGMPVLVYDPASRGAVAYRALAREIAVPVETARPDAEA